MKEAPQVSSSVAAALGDPQWFCQALPFLEVTLWLVRPGFLSLLPQGNTVSRIQLTCWSLLSLSLSLTLVSPAIVASAAL